MSAAGFFIAAAVLVVAALMVVAAPGVRVAAGGLLALLLGLVGMDLVTTAPLLGLLQFGGAVVPVAVLAGWGYRTNHPLSREHAAWVRAWPVAVIAALGFVVAAVVAAAGDPRWYVGGAQETFHDILRHRTAPVAVALVVLVLISGLGARTLAHVDAEEAHHERTVADRRARREREERRREDRARARGQSGTDTKS